MYDKKLRKNEKITEKPCKKYLKIIIARKILNRNCNREKKTSNLKFK